MVRVETCSFCQVMIAGEKRACIGGKMTNLMSAVDGSEGQRLLAQGTLNVESKTFRNKNFPDPSCELRKYLGR